MTESSAARWERPRHQSPFKRRGGRRIEINPPTKSRQDHHPRMQQRAQLRRQVRSPRDEKGKPIIDTPSDDRGTPQQQQARPPRRSNCACGWRNKYLRNPKEESTPERETTADLSESNIQQRKIGASSQATTKKSRGQKRIRDRLDLQPGHQTKEWGGGKRGWMETGTRDKVLARTKGAQQQRVPKSGSGRKKQKCLASENQ